jgi:radical SAM superfamily enzyme YgiQ (UPF0313 family)
MGAAISLRSPGAVLLLSCYELGHQPQGLASPLAFLERAGFAPGALDLAVEPFDEARVRRARFVGISVPMHTALRLGVAAARRVRRVNPGVHIALYGLYATLNADYLRDGVADSVVGGEYEEALVTLVASLERAERPAPRMAPVLERLAFPVPSRTALPPLRTYTALIEGGGRRPAGYVEASRGCLHHCLHCPIPPVYGGRFFVVPPEVVLADIRGQVGAGATHITFGDPDFLNGPGHSLKIVRVMHAEFPTLTFDCTAKVEHLLRRRALLPELASLGCRFIVSAVESLSDTVLANLDKGHTRADVYAALGALREAGIALRPSLLPFTPWTTLHDYSELLDFVAAEGLVYHVDPVQYGIRLLVPPGSALLGRPAMRPFLGPPLAPPDPAALTYTWTHPDPRMDELQHEVMVIVERGAREEEETPATFLQVCEAACRATGRPAAPSLPRLAPGPRPPRLSEPWFC